MNRLRIIPLDDTVVFPGMPVTLSVDVGSDDRVLLVPEAAEHVRTRWASSRKCPSACGSPAAGSPCR